MNTFNLLALKSIDWLGVPNGSGHQAAVTDQDRQLVMILLFATSVILTIWLLSRIQNRMQAPQRPRRPYRLLGDLLKHHGVTLADRWMLLFLTRSQHMKQPTLLLLSPSLFARYAEAWLTGTRSGAVWPSARQRLVRVAQKVFNEDATQR